MLRWGHKESNQSNKMYFRKKKIDHGQVSAEHKLGLTKVSPYLFLMLINPIEPKLTVLNRASVLPKLSSAAVVFDSLRIIKLMTKT